MKKKSLSVKRKNHNLILKHLNDKDILKVFKEFKKTIDIKNKYAVAVSGGPDSLALAFLAKIYAIKNKLISKFFIIDHKLRSESTKEANKVKKVLKKFSIDSKILTWKGKKPLNNIQSSARNKRYELLLYQIK